MLRVTHFSMLAIACLLLAMATRMVTASWKNRYEDPDEGSRGKGKGPIDDECDEVIKVTELNEITGSRRYTGVGPIFNDGADRPNSPNFALYFSNEIFSGFQTPTAASKVGLFSGGCHGIELTEAGEAAKEYCTLQATIDGRGTFVMQGINNIVESAFLFSITGGSGNFLGVYGTDMGGFTDAYTGGNGPLGDMRTEAYEHEFCLYFPKH